MQIGADFPKIEFELLGFELLEPNTFIGDTVLFVFSMYAAYQVFRLQKEHLFHRSWFLFFVVFGIGFFVGGFGHLFYNYWGIPGKIPSWVLGVIAVFLIERAMISLIDHNSLKKTLSLISKVKLILALAGVLLVLCFVDLSVDYSKGMIVPTINSTIGLFGALGILAFVLSKRISGMTPFIVSVIVLIPAAVIQAMKINIHPWFDKNDLSHFLLLIALFLYLKGVKIITERNSNALLVEG